MDITQYSSKIRKIDPDSHKGQNGKVMVIGGSELFHAASRWALDVVSAMVDMVFYSSIPENNELIKEAKQNFWSGVVIPRGEVESYIAEADVVLIGPGMTREKYVNDKWSELLLSGCTWKTIEGVRSRNSVTSLSVSVLERLKSEIDWERDTYAIINYLIVKYPSKKWVIDAGALQMIEPALLNDRMVITPHFKELQMVFNSLEKWINAPSTEEDVIVGHFQCSVYKEYFDGLDLTGTEDDEYMKKSLHNDCLNLSQSVGGATLLLKDKQDKIISQTKVELVNGGNAGMTKGGTGDALAGLVAGLYAFTDDPFTAAVVGSYVNKKAGDELYKMVGPFFTTNQLVNQIPKTLKLVLGY